MKSIKMALLAGVLILAQACESLVHGTTQDVSITTTSSGASIMPSIGSGCTSPCRLSSARTEVLTIIATKADCRPGHGRVVPAVTEEATLFGTIFDYWLGGAYHLKPAPLDLILICGEEAQRPPPGLTIEEGALIKDFVKPDDNGK